MSDIERLLRAADMQDKASLEALCRALQRAGYAEDFSTRPLHYYFDGIEETYYVTTSRLGERDMVAVSALLSSSWEAIVALEERDAPRAGPAERPPVALFVEVHSAGLTEMTWLSSVEWYRSLMFKMWQDSERALETRTEVSGRGTTARWSVFGVTTRLVGLRVMQRAREGLADALEGMGHAEYLQAAGGSK